MSNKIIQLEKELKLTKDKLITKTTDYEKLEKNYWILRDWWVDLDRQRQWDKESKPTFKNVK